MEKMSVMMEEYQKYAGELGDCKSKEDRDSWLSGFGAFVLGWQARGQRLLTPDAADLAVCTCEEINPDTIKVDPACRVHGNSPSR